MVKHKLAHIVRIFNLILKWPKGRKFNLLPHID